MMKVSITIPTLNAESYITQLILKLNSQTFPPTEIIVVDSSSEDLTVRMASKSGCNTAIVERETFNHGGTRNLAARMTKGDILVFMTQDALPANNEFLEELVRPIVEGVAVASFARQVPRHNASPLERFAREFNYPAVSHINTTHDLPRRGVKTFFFSNVASAVSREHFWEVGGFPERVILNEDMFLSAKLQRAGYAVAYQASAEVYHSHQYSISQQFKRYFDIGVSMTQAGDLLSGAASGGEGVRFALAQVRYLLSCGAWHLVPRSLAESMVKFIAYNLGRREKWMPKALKKRLSMHSFFWDSY